MLLLSCGQSHAQYTGITIGDGPSSTKILRVDYRDYSTLVFFEYTRPDGHDVCNFNENTYISLPNDATKYHLINSVNMPIYNGMTERWAIVDQPNQVHHFILEFEKIPELQDFDIIENSSDPDAFNFHRVHIADTTKRDYGNIDAFIADSPLKERGKTWVNGNQFDYIKAGNITITANCAITKKYGKYYTLYADITNHGSKSVMFSMNNVNATGYTLKKDQLKPQEMTLMTAKDYDKRINRTHFWETLVAAAGSALAEEEASKKTITTETTENSSTSVDAHADASGNAAYGYISNDGYGLGTISSYGSADAYANVYTTTYGKSTTVIKDPVAAQIAREQTDQYMNELAQSNHEIKQRLGEGYMESTVIPAQSVYSGFFHIKHKKIDTLRVDFVIDGVTFPFTFNTSTD